MARRIAALDPLLAAALLAALVPAVPAPGQDGTLPAKWTPPTTVNRDGVLIQSYRDELRGGVLVAGCGVRGGGGPEVQGTIRLAGIPSTATVVKAILNWSIMDSAAPSPVVTFHLATSPPGTVTGTLLGGDDDPCWSIGSEWVFSADVTALIAGDGDYLFRLPDSGVLNIPPTSEGASLIVVYCDPGAPMVDVVVYEGFETQISGDTIQTISGFDAAATIGLARATFIVADGQGIWSPGAAAAATINATEVIGPIFDGDEGACASPIQQFYDVDTIDVSALVAPGATSLEATVVSLGDCLNWNAFVLEIATDTVGPPPAPCAPNCPVPPGAVPGAGASVCPGDAAVLDGSASTACSAAGLQYRWLDGTTPVCGWSPSPSCVVTPAATTTYTLEVACLDSPLCTDSATVTVAVTPPPLADLTPLAAVCPGAAVTLDASGSTPGACSQPLEFQFRDGATVLQAWSPLATFGPFPATVSTTFTLEARCPDAPDCVASDAEALAVVPEPQAVLAPLVALCAGGSVTLDATGSLPNGCPVALEYRFRAGATVLADWGPAATYGPFVPAASGTYSADVRCTAVPGCATTASGDLLLVARPSPDLAAAGTVCAGTQVTLDASASAPNGCPDPLEFQFRDGATVLQAWSPLATFGPFPATASATYSADVRCPTAAACEAAASRPLAVVDPPRAVLAALPALCAGGPATLDASASDPANCPTGLEYQFSAGATVLRAWSPGATYGPVTPAVSTTYTAEARCPAAPGCVDQASQLQTVVPVPTARAGSDVDVCEGVAVTLSGAASSAPGCAGGPLFEWREGATVMRPASPAPTWAPPTATASNVTYTLVVSCASTASCAGSDDVVVNVRRCPMAVRFAEVGATLDAGGRHAEVYWTTASEHGTLRFTVERAEAAAGPYLPTAMAAQARGSLSSYRVADPLEVVAGRTYYRIVEWTESGRGDQSPAFAPRGAAHPGAGRERGARRRGR